MPPNGKRKGYTTMKEFLHSPVRAVCAGVPLLHASLVAQGATAVQLDWRPPAGGDPKLVAALARLTSRPEVRAANQKAIAALQAAQPYVIDVQPAGAVIPGMTRDTVLHAGPPVKWESMSGPMRGALIGGLIYEGLAADAAGAVALAERDGIRLRPCHEHHAVGPMGGITTYSMPVFVAENRAAGNRAYCNLNEGPGRRLRYGAYGPDVIERLHWMGRTLAPALQAALRRAGGIDLKSLTAQAVHMGDECHSRNKAASSLFLRALLPHLVASAGSALAEVVDFLATNDYFYLNLSMVASKAILDAAHGIPHSTLVTAMARNGTEVGIRVSGLGNRWFTGPAQRVEGLYFPGYGPADANPDIGDSAITETAGVGGCVLAAAPAIVGFVGGTVADAMAYTAKMYEITMAENPAVTIPALNFRGAPLGFDVCKIVETGILPVFTTGISHKEPGVGQIGAGIVSPPREVFAAALLACAEQYLPEG